MRIRLRANEDNELMAELRAAQVPNPGAQTVEGVTNVGDVTQLNEIGANENIIFEGHGTYDTPTFFFIAPKVVGQGRLSPRSLAVLANAVPKPAVWNGKIILLGCNTGTITSQVSKEYHNLAQTPVTVVGTPDNIKVGMKEDQTNFVGVDYARLPENQRPTDYLFVCELFAATESFQEGASDLIELARQLSKYRSGKRQDITLNLDTIVEMASDIVSVDGKSTNPKVDQKNYMAIERGQAFTLFADLVSAVERVSFFKRPAAVTPLTGSLVETQTMAPVLTAAQALLQGLGTTFLDLQRYFRGLNLKEVDLADPTSSKHSRMTPTGFLGSWTESA